MSLASEKNDIVMMGTKTQIHVVVPQHRLLSLYTNLESPSNAK